MGFRASFRGKRRPDKIHQKSPAIFNAKFPGKLKKKSTKVFSRAGKVSFCVFLGICCISESAEKLHKVFGSGTQCTFSLENVLLLGFGSRRLLRKPPDAENGRPVVHICWGTLVALQKKEIQQKRGKDDHPDPI